LSKNSLSTELTKAFDPSPHFVIASFASTQCVWSGNTLFLFKTVSNFRNIQCGWQIEWRISRGECQ